MSFQQPEKALDNIFSERVRREKISECRNLCGVVLHPNDAKKNLNGRVRYSIKHDWNSNHGKTLSGTCRITSLYRGRVRGLDLEVGFCGIATRAVMVPDPLDEPAPFTIIPAQYITVLWKLYSDSMKL